MHSRSFGVDYARYIILSSSGVVFAFATVTIIGWAAGLPILTSLLPGYPAMRPVTAIMFLLPAGALYLAARYPERWLRPVTTLGALMAAASVILLIFAAISYTAGVDGVDVKVRSTVLPSEQSILGFLVLGISLITLGLHKRFGHLSALTALCVFGSAFLAFLGHLYNAAQTEALLEHGLAIGTITCFAAASVGMLAANPACMLVQMLRSDTLGGATARRLLPAAMLVPTLIGWLRVMGQDRGYFDTAVGSTLAIFTLVVLMFGIIYFYSRRLHSSDEDRKRTEQMLTDQEQRYRDLFDYSQGILSTHDISGRLTSVNRALSISLGFSAEELIGDTFQDHIQPEYRSQFDAYLRQVLNEGEAKGLVSMVSKNGEIVVWQYHNILVTDPGKEPFVLGSALDVTHHVKAQHSLKKMSLTDELTGLYNRRGFITHAEQQLLLERHSGTARGLTLMFLDMDGLKGINDNFGHEAGSEAIKTLADLIKSVVRSADIVARWGGDEFVVLTIGSGAESSDLWVDRIRDRIDEYNLHGQRPYTISCSIGISPIRKGEQRTFEAIVAEADEAMYNDKKQRHSARGRQVPTTAGAPTEIGAV